MTNIITNLQERNKELSNRIADLEKQLSSKEQEFKPLNNEQIRQWVISILSSSYGSDMDVKALDIIMQCYCNQENWSAFCKWYPTENIRRDIVYNAYKFNHYYNLTNKLYGVRNDARKSIILNLIKLNSEESKELFRKWLREGKLEDSLTLKEFLEEGYKSDPISQNCYSYLDIRNLSLDELINSWNELTANAFKQKQEYEAKIAELEPKNKELETKLGESEEEVWMEREEAEKALNTAMKWRKRQMFETVLKHDAAMGKLLDQIDLLENNLAAKNQEIDWRNYLENKELPSLPKQQKENRLHKLKKLISKVKEKSKENFYHSKEVNMRLEYRV